jgi:hypothetical protein
VDKEFYDKYSKDLECSCCQDLEHCINGKEPLKINCAIHFFKDKIAELETKLAKSDEYKELLLEEKAGYLDLISGYADKCKELKQQLAEKEKEVSKWKNKKIKYLVDNLLVDRNLAIQTVEEIREDFRQNSFCNDYHEYIVNMEIFEYFHNKIKSLKGDL